MITPTDCQRQGFWSSELDEKTAIGASVEYSQLQCSAEGLLCWVEQRPLDNARSVLCGSNEGGIKDITPPGYSVRSKVHEYGGMGWCFIDKDVVFVNESDQQLYRQSLGVIDSICKLTDIPNSRFIEPVWDASNNRLIVIEELHDSAEVVNRLVSICLASGQLLVLHSGYDFYSYPSINPVNGDIAFIAWSHPYQPWISTQLILLTEDIAEIVLGSDSRSGVAESLSQPLYTEEGSLYIISDRSGWWNIYQYVSADKLLRPHFPANKEQMSAPWQTGLRHYVDHKGVSYVQIAHKGGELFYRGELCDISDIANIRALSACGDSLYALASFGSKTDAVVKIGVDGVLSILAGGESPLEASDCSLPIPLEFGGVDSNSYGYLYPATNKNALRGVEATPLVVFLHGGPTAATYPILNLKIQYWTQRGFSVLDLNYRGSTNYGRDYRLSLNEAWGVLEVEDIDNAVRYLVENDYCRPDAVFIRGNSSGGYSALRALTQLDCFAGGASLYGVTDPLVLNECTHKFESHYLEWLIGDPVIDKARYDALSPVNNASQIESPVIFFQGEQDRVVLPDQTRAMVDVLRQRDIEVKAIYFEDEAHGFRKIENATEVLRSELAFYQACLSRSA